ncbi:MAG: hypothetical protein A4E19_07230 [Nitrospira sp. SG-bin1]|nr:MAG: hypothetical protein A4E19_07230 [Nitrospira sp. SG-bin1]
MEPTVIQGGKRPHFSSPPDASFGSCSSSAALSLLSVAPLAEPILGKGSTGPDDAYVLAEKSGGQVSATPFSLDSQTNRPQRASQQTHTLNPHANAKVEPRAMHSILVVEDDPDIAMALQDLLEFEGFHVDCVQTCRQAFSSIEQNIYDAILLDLGLPDGDGSLIVERLQNSHPSLPVIVLTASNRDLAPLRAYAHLTKPWERKELCGILHRAVGTGSPWRVG